MIFPQVTMFLSNFFLATIRGKYFVRLSVDIIEVK